MFQCTFLEMGNNKEQWFHLSQVVSSWVFLCNTPYISMHILIPTSLSDSLNLESLQEPEQDACCWETASSEEDRVAAPMKAQLYKQDLLKEHTSQHANEKGGKFPRPQSSMKSYRQSVAVVRERSVLFPSRDYPPDWQAIASGQS